MKILIKKDNKLVNLGEGRIYSKKQLKLVENGFDANLGQANGIAQAQMQAKQLMAKNPNVTSASADAGKLDGQVDTNGGEGLKLEVPINASGNQLAQAQRMVKDQSADDAQITFTKQNTATTNSMSESKLMEMRKSSIPFTKKELNAFLSTL
jgi:hypothetical protein